MVLNSMFTGSQQENNRNIRNIEYVHNYPNVLKVRSVLNILLLFLNQTTALIYYNEKDPIYVEQTISKSQINQPVRLVFPLSNTYISPIQKPFDKTSFDELLFDFQIRFKITDNQMDDHFKNYKIIDQQFETVLADLELIFSILYNIKIKNEVSSQFNGLNSFTYHMSNNNPLKLNFVSKKDSVSINMLTLKEDVQNLLTAVEKYLEIVLKEIQQNQGSIFLSLFGMGAYQNPIMVQQNNVNVLMDRVKYNIMEALLSVKPHFNELNVLTNEKDIGGNFLSNFDRDSLIYLECGTIVERKDLWEHLLQFEGHGICGRKLIDKVNIRSGLDIV